ncbi:MAG: D-alanine--D-alanine ligase family protein [Acidobacteriota bacterium]
MPESSRIVLLFGGCSVEHEVSIRSARTVLLALRERDEKVLPVAIDRDGVWFTADNPLHVYREEGAEGARFPARLHPGAGGALRIGEGSAAWTAEPEIYLPLVHGTGGEDGSLQGVLEAAQAAYAGSGVLASALAMDKAMAKGILKQAGLPVLEGRTVTAAAWARNPEAVLDGLDRWSGAPVFVKPCNGGSSVGVARAAGKEARRAAIENALCYDVRILVEPALAAREIEVSVLGNEEPRTSMPGEIVPSRDFYDYTAKYVDGQTRLLVPAPLARAQAEEIRRLAGDAFQALDGSGFGRVDFLLEKETGRAYISEVNTIPGFTDISMYPRLWEASGMSLGDLLDEIVRLGLERHEARQKLRRSML